MVYQTEQALSELGDKVSAEDKASVEGPLNNLKEALKGSDVEAIKSATETLTQAFYAISQKLYQQDPQAGAGAAGQNCGGDCGGNCGQDGGNNQGYYDADYEVVDDDQQ
jgi:molecular chaperone DnaK